MSIWSIYLFIYSSANSFMRSRAVIVNVPHEISINCNVFLISYQTPMANMITMYRPVREAFREPAQFAFVAPIFELDFVHA